MIGLKSKKDKEVDNNHTALDKCPGQGDTPILGEEKKAGPVSKISGGDAAKTTKELTPFFPDSDPSKSLVEKGTLHKQSKAGVRNKGTGKKTKSQTRPLQTQKLQEVGTNSTLDNGVYQVNYDKSEQLKRLLKNLGITPSIKLNNQSDEAETDIGADVKEEDSMETNKYAFKHTHSPDPKDIPIPNLRKIT